MFATTALGMGVDFAGVHTVIHYGAPRSIDDYFQESGRAGRDGKLSTSTVYWLPADVPLKKDLSNRVNVDIVAVRHYLENNQECRRCQLLRYFDESLVWSLERRQLSICCDVCKLVIK